MVGCSGRSISSGDRVVTVTLSTRRSRRRTDTRKFAGNDLVNLATPSPPTTFRDDGVRLVERARWEWWRGDPVDPASGLMRFLTAHGLPTDLSGPVAPAAAPARVGRWSTSWTDAEHAAAVRAVRAAIAEGDVYQVTVVGHRSAPYSGDPAAALAAVAALPGARYGGGLSGPGWAVATASPECLLTVERGLARTSPVKGTRPATASGRAELLASGKERAEHVMIVDLVRNDL